MKAIGVLIAIGLALALQTTLARFLVGGTAALDLVLVVDTYHHIPNRVAYFTELKARMKPGARLAIVDFRKDSPSGPPPEFRFTPDQISEELASAGFALQTRLDFLPRQIFLIYGAK